MENFKLRASAAGKLVTNPRSKNDLLSETTKTYLKDWAKSKIFGIEKVIDSKYIRKGLILEDEAIDKAIEWLNIPFCIKNEQFFEDDFFTGTPDLILENEVLDIKNSWDLWTFPLFEDELPNDDYYAQMQVYLHLTGKKHGAVVYVLLNTPATYNTPEITYDHVEISKRIKSFDVDYDPDFIEKLKTRVVESRNYLNIIL